MYPNKEVNILFILLRAGLWEKEPESLSLFPLSGESWENIYRMARRQTVTGLVYRGVCHLPDEMLPPEKLLVRWVAEINAIEQRNHRMNAVLAELYEMFRNDGLTPVLQKGQSAALFYEFPLLRECGDIDFYFPYKNEREFAIRIVKNRGIRVDWQPDDSVSYIWNSIEVEHHPRMLDLYNPFLHEDLNSLETLFGYHDVWLSPGCEITIPSPTLYVLLLNTHIMKHAIGRGIGLRQLCDMARACHRLHIAVTSSEIKNICCKAGIIGWNRLLHSFLVEHLGLPVTSLPYKDRPVSSRPLLERVLEGGNFGQYRMERTPGTQAVWQRKLYTAHSFLRNVSLSFGYVPKEAFWTFTNLLTGQVK